MFPRLTLPTAHGARAYIPAAQPHSPRGILGMETPWAVSLGGTLALPAGRSSAPPLPAWLGPPTAGWLGAHVASWLWSAANPAEPTPRPAPCAPSRELGTRPRGCSPGDRFLRSVLSYPPLPTIHPQFQKASENGGWGRSGPALCSRSTRRGFCCRGAATNYHHHHHLLLFQIIIP